MTGCPWCVWRTWLQSPVAQVALTTHMAQVHPDRVHDEITAEGEEKR